VEADGRLVDGEGLAAEARLLHALFDRLPAMVAYWDRDLGNVIANEAYVEWFGFRPEQMRGVHIREVLGERVYAMNLPYIEGALAGEEQLFDRTLVDTTGRTRHTQASYVPDVVDGEVRGFFVLVTDVTPRVEAQRAMDEAQSLARLGSSSLDVATGAMSWSHELYRIFGVDETDFVPTLASLAARVHPDDAARVQAVRDRAMASTEEYAADYRICRPDGSVREVHSRGRPILDPSGRVVRLTGTIQDVTDANEAARELSRVNAELIQLNELNADVLGMLGHDVRGPLTVVLGYLEELDDEWDISTDADRRSHLATVRSAAVRLRGLVDDILAMASVDSGSIVSQVASHDLAHLVHGALEDLPGRAAVTFRSTDEDIRCRCDAFHVRQIVANLVGNALRYGAPPVVVSIDGGDGVARVTVSDRGAGVPEEFVPHLFERFSRAHGEAHAGGSGLGLYIASKLTEANGGSLRYEPAPDGGGARFVLTLPRA
jgi:PAS domain S-box-containing protein